MSDDDKTHSYAVVFENATETVPDWDRIATEQRGRSKEKPAETASVDSGWPPPGVA